MPNRIEPVIVRALTAAGIPFTGVTFGVITDRATWTVQFDATATPAQMTTAQNILNNTVLDPAVEADLDAIGEVDMKALTAAVRATWECIPAPTKTLVQLRARAIAIWKTL